MGIPRKSLCLGLFFGVASWASPANAELLVSEPFNDSVVDVELGGDVSGIPRFATGLAGPAGLCFGPGAEIYAVEQETGEVTVITEGGDFTGAVPFAVGFDQPGALACIGSDIFIVEIFNGRVLDISAGGDFTGAPSIAAVPGYAVDLIGDSHGTLWVATTTFAEGDEIYDVTAGFMGVPYAFGGSWVTSITETADGALLAAGLGSSSSSVLDWTAGGYLPDADPFAEGEYIGHLLGTENALWAIDSTGIVDISGGGDIGALGYHATGIEEGFSFATVTDILYIPIECGNAYAQAGEFCDDGEMTAECDDDCTAVTCGDGTLNDLAGEGCDDAGESAACNADCTVSTCGDAVVNATADETCDDGGESAACDADCTVAACGDETVNAAAGETCDDGGESAACNADCTVASCGDGVVNATAGEECDAAGASDACTDDCRIDHDAACGNGVVDAAEECDDGGPSQSCDVDCTAAVCGDRTVNAAAGEACDDGDNSATCDADCSAAICGDGFLNPAAGEICEDGNAVGGDGCSATCVGEPPDGAGEEEEDDEGDSDTEGALEDLLDDSVDGCTCSASGRGGGGIAGLFVMLALALRRRSRVRRTRM